MKDNGGSCKDEESQSLCRENRARANMGRVEEIIWRPEIGELGHGCSEEAEDRGENGAFKEKCSNQCDRWEKACEAYGIT